MNVSRARSAGRLGGLAGVDADGAFLVDGVMDGTELIAVSI